MAYDTLVFLLVCCCFSICVIVAIFIGSVTSGCFSYIMSRFQRWTFIHGTQQCIEFMFVLYVFKCLMCGFDCWSCCRGYKRFFKRTNLETSDYLKDDCLQIHCCVGVVRSHTEGPKIYSIPVPEPDIGKDFGQLLESGDQSDVRFEVDGEIFAAHKLVLAARSPVLRAQLFGPMKDQNTEFIKVEDVEAPVFKVEAFNFAVCIYMAFCFLIKLPLLLLCPESMGTHYSLLLEVMLKPFIIEKNKFCGGQWLFYVSLFDSCGVLDASS